MAMRATGGWSGHAHSTVTLLLPKLPRSRCASYAWTWKNEINNAKRKMQKATEEKLNLVREEQKKWNLGNHPRFLPQAVRAEVVLQC